MQKRVLLIIILLSWLIITIVSANADVPIGWVNVAHEFKTNSSCKNCHQISDASWGDLASEASTTLNKVILQRTSPATVMQEKNGTLHVITHKHRQNESESILILYIYK